MSTLEECLGTVAPVASGVVVPWEACVRALGAARDLIKLRMAGREEEDPFATAESAEGPLAWLQVLNAVWDAALSDATDPGLQGVFVEETQTLGGAVVKTALRCLQESDMDGGATVRGKRVLSGELLLKYVLNGQLDGGELADLIEWLKSRSEKSLSCVYVVTAVLAALDSSSVDTISATAGKVLATASERIHAIVNGPWPGRGVELTSPASTSREKVSQPGLQSVVQLAWGTYMAVASLSGIKVSAGGRAQLVSATTAEDEVFAAFDGHVWSHLARGGLLHWGHAPEGDVHVAEKDELSMRDLSDVSPMSSVVLPAATVSPFQASLSGPMVSSPRVPPIMQASAAWLDRTTPPIDDDPWSDVLYSDTDSGQARETPASAKLDALRSALAATTSNPLSQNRLTLLPELGTSILGTSAPANNAPAQLLPPPSTDAASGHYSYRIPVFAQSPESPYIQRALLTQIHTLVLSCIQYTAVALRRLRTHQDDVNIAVARGIADARPMYELEALFLVVAKLASHSPELALPFWDASSPVSSFLPWALDANASSRSRLACLDMCTVLAHGPRAATAAFEFFSDQHRPVSWAALLNALAFYAQYLPKSAPVALGVPSPAVATAAPSTQGTPFPEASSLAFQATPFHTTPFQAAPFHSTPVPPRVTDAVQPNAEIPEQEVTHLVAYLRLMSRIVLASHVARASLVNSLTPRPLSSIFTLLQRTIPPVLRAALIDTLAAFARPSHVLKDSVTFRVWSFLQASPWFV